MFSLLPSKTAIWGAIVALLSAVVVWLRLDAKKDFQQQMELDDHENAQDIRERVARVDPDRMRKHEGNYRD